MRNSCQNFHALAVTEPPEKNDMLVARMRCKKWSCDYCAKVNQTMWRTWIIKRVAELGGTWVFVTVTAHEKAHRAGRSLENLRGGWDSLVKRLKRAIEPQKLEYVRVFEGHKSKQFHIHAIMRFNPNEENTPHGKKKKMYLSKWTKWFKDNARECGMGYQALAVKIPDNGTGGLVASYVTKYMTKGAQELGDMPRGIRRIQTTQGIGACKPTTPTYDWRIRHGIYKQDLAEHDNVIDISTGEKLHDYYFKTYWYWPQHEEDEN